MKDFSPKLTKPRTYRLPAGSHLVETAWQNPVGTVLHAERFSHDGELADDNFMSTLPVSPFRASVALIDLLATKPSGKLSSRPRSTKVETDLKVIEAKTYKMDHPGESTTAVAKAVDIARTTLTSRPDWDEWCLQVERVNNNGKLEEMKTQLDKLAGDVVAHRNSD